MIRFSTRMMFLFILCMFGFSALFYPTLPDQMASHWNARGQVDGYMPKPVSLFLIPALSLIVMPMLTALGCIDSFQRNFRWFRVFTDVYSFLLMAFLFAGQIFIITWNLGFKMWDQGFKIQINVLLLIPLSILFFGLSCVMEKIGPNGLIGIRVPWTLNNEKVWRRTHLWSAALFKLAAAVMLFGVICEEKYTMIFILVPILGASLIAIILSYVFSQQENAL